ncbi:type VI secretion system baseplate subunit TssF [Citrobacter sp. FP75]|uniref:type VI secretion system baseplate subunit TssF n=1 Tax=Citrobacter sp. FP75 TaxID=1852949 RepID=UPI001BC8ECF7|nr:type VI secretion system baseplate subunit TssF [Citrobacter sp. FP75]
MDDRLLEDYLQELRWLRTASGEFARRHPRVAARLRLSEFECPDPHVERLLEGFALQSARLHQRLDDGFGELCESLLEQLSPHLMRPFPSVATACFVPDPQAGDLSQGYPLPAGTPLYTLTESGETIWWRTALTQTLWPLEIEDVAWCDATQAQQLSGLAQARGALRIQLRCLPPHQFSALAVNQLRIHLCGSPQINATLFDLLYAHVIGPRRPQPVGLLNAERILPGESGVESSALALSAWMHCPQALMYFDLPLAQVSEGETMTLCIPFDRAPQAAQHIQSGDIRLGCTPVINLFTRTSEPLLAEHTRSEHRLVADHHDKNVHIYRVQALWMSRREEAWRIPPYYSAHGHSDARWYWHARRHHRQGNEMWLTLVDSQFDPLEAADEYSLTAKLWCTNGAMASLLSAGTSLTFEQPGPVAQVHLLGTPTTPSEPVSQRDARWKLLSSLALNHLSLTEGEMALASLKELLALYAPSAASPAVWQQINGIDAIRSQRVSEHRGRDAWRGWCNGIRVTLVLNPEAFTGSSRLLFAGIIARFLARNATANCFVRTVLQDEGEELSLWTETEQSALIA